MRIAVIDIGSNSVRLSMMADGKTLYKKMETTRLGEGLSVSGMIKPEASDRTLNAVENFRLSALSDGAEEVFIFATEAVRSAENGGMFVNCAKSLGITVDVIDGKTEAEIGLLGALGESDGGIIDVGGASTEISVKKGGSIVFTKSVKVGTVRLNDLAGRDRGALEKVIDEKLKEYGEHNFSETDMRAIGGTATRLASVKCGLKEYKPEISDGTVLTLEDMDRLSDMLLTLSVEEIRKNTICTKSADIVGGGCLLMYKIMQKFGISRIKVSESDNLEGYYLYRQGRK